MTNTFEPDDIELPYHERAVRALLGCLCTGPRDAADGEWVVLLEGPDAEPLALGHVGLVFDSEVAPLGARSEALRRAGYEYCQAVVTTPWAAEWQIIRPEDRQITPQPDP